MRNQCALTFKKVKNKKKRIESVLEWMKRKNWTNLWCQFGIPSMSQCLLSACYSAKMWCNYMKLSYPCFFPFFILPKRLWWLIWCCFNSNYLCMLTHNWCVLGAKSSGKSFYKFIDNSKAIKNEANKNEIGNAAKRNKRLSYLSLMCWELGSG